jgi:site-specific DNA-methyltransferase (adenine-specific)
MQSNHLILENQTIYFKSSENMSELSDGCIDVIVTSPPYNRGKNYSSDSAEKYNDNMDELEYLEFLKRVWTECLRVASKKALFFLNIGDSASDQGISEKVAKSAEETGWIRIQDIIWVKSIHGKGHYTPSGGNKRLNNVWEHIYLFVKNKQEYMLDSKAIGIPYADKSNIGRYGDSDLRDPGNVFHIVYEKTTGANIKKGHEAPFPIGLPYICIKLVSNAKTVLDPFLGTGTTLAAANALSISGYGYEKYPRQDLINSTIIDGKNYEPDVPVLIPHFESSISSLIEIIENNNITLDLPKSKKEKQERLILVDTLKKMGIQSKLISILEKNNENPNEILGKNHSDKEKNTSLDDYVKKE